MKAKDQFDIENYLTYAMDWFDKLEGLQQHAVISWCGARRGGDELISAHHAVATKHAWFIDCKTCYNVEIRTVPKLQNEIPSSLDDLIDQPLRPQTDKYCTLCGEGLNK